MTKLQAEIIVALAENQLSISETARKIYLHRNTVTYHVRKVMEQTNKNPLDFYDMCDLLPVAQKILCGKVYVTDQTQHALLEIGRKSHGECR